MKKTIGKTKLYLINHKKTSVVFLIVLLVLGYWGYKKFTNTDDEPRYITAKVERGTIVVSVSGSGQVSSLNQIDIKSKVSGDVIYLPRKNGDAVSKGALIAQLDATDAEKSVRDAEINLESAKISLEKLKIEKSKENMNADLAKSYDDGFNTVSNVFLDLPGIMTGLNDMFFKNNPGTSQWNVDWYEGQVKNEDREKTKIFKQSFVDSFKKAKDNYDISFDNYKIVSRTSDSPAIENLILQTYNTTKLISDTIKNANNYIDFVNDSIQKNNADTPAIIATHKNILSGYTSKTNTHLINLLETTTSIKDYKDAFLNSDLDIQSSELSLKQKENALQDAKDKLKDYFIRAPFDGTLAVVNIKTANSVNAGTLIGTLITQNQISEISLNEVDVAKIKIGQQATLTFDAIPDLTVSGVIVEIDTVGTISQGVVTYIVKISFNTQDERIKPAMSVSGTIVTDMKENVLLVPNSAIKSLVEKNYVEILNLTPVKIPVEVGLSNDSQSEIISGIEESDEIIVRTIQPTTNGSTAPSIFGAPPANRNSGNVRIQAR